MTERIQVTRLDAARWGARILGTMLIICSILPAVFDFPHPLKLAAGEQVHSVGFLIILVGLFLAWRFEAAGGAVILGGVAFYWIADATLVQQAWPGRFFGLAGVIGILYLYCAWQAQQRGLGKRYRRRVVVLAQTGALLLLILLVLTGIFEDHFFPQPWRYITPDVRAAREHFSARTDAFSLTIYPIHVIKGREIEHDAELGRQLGTLLGAESPFTVNPTTAPMDVPILWGKNQAKMLRQSAEAFQARVADLQLETDYALMAEILGGCDEGIGGVHYYIVDRAGRLITMSLANSHHRDWRALDPQGIEGGFELLAARLAEDFARP